MMFENMGRIHLQAEKLVYAILFLLGLDIIDISNYVVFSRF